MIVTPILTLLFLIVAAGGVQDVLPACHEAMMANLAVVAEERRSDRAAVAAHDGELWDMHGRQHGEPALDPAPG